MKNLSVELNFIGKIKKIEWFNENLTEIPWFTDLIQKIFSQKSETTLRNILYSLFPISEYLAHIQNEKVNIFSCFVNWQKFIIKNEGLFIELIVTHGTQGNIPQRVAIVIDYLSRNNLLDDYNTIIELGCSGGLMGCVFENYHELFSNDDIFKKYFWLKRKPKIPSTDIHFSYVGYDLKSPPVQLIPFFVWDKDKRKKVQMFVDNYKLNGVIFQESFVGLLKNAGIISQHKVFLLTSFVLYQLSNAIFVQELILNKVNSRIHWLDLSRNNGLPSLFAGLDRLKSNWIYLSHNGKPVAEIINGSDDCPDWIYL